MHKDEVSLLTFPGSAFVTCRCVGNMKPVLQAEAPGQVDRPFSQVECCLLHSAVCAVL